MAGVKEYSGADLNTISRLSGVSNVLDKINGVSVSAATLLLDTYTGAAAAYSVRKLRTAYAGSAIRVREDSGDTELDIGFDSNGDLDTAAIATHCGVNNGYVVTWYDQSGNANNATQSTNGSQPQIYNGTAVITENGKPAMQFDGSDDQMKGIAVASAAANTYSIVLKPDSISDRVFGRPNAASTSLLMGAPELRLLDYETNPTVFTVAGATITTTQSLAFAYITNANKTPRIGINGGTFAVGTTLTKDLEVIGTAETDARLGAGQSDSNFYEGKIQEFVLWTTDHGTSNRTGIETNINTYFSIYT